MRSHRLNRLAVLTQGVALVGLGSNAVACSKEAASTEPIHINSPPMTTGDAAREPLHMNAPPRPTSGLGADSDASSAPAGSAPRP